MFKNWTWGDAVFFVALIGLVLLVQVGPAFSDAQLARFNIGTGLAFSGLLVWVTARYTRETTKMARASKDQAEAMRDQLNLEYEPNLVLTVEVVDAETADYRIVNLGKHPVWITEILSTAAYRSTYLLVPDPRRPPRHQFGLLSGEAVPVTPFPPATIPEADENGNPFRQIANKSTYTDLTVKFFYGSTGPQEHTQTWNIKRGMAQRGEAPLKYSAARPPRIALLSRRQ